MELSKYRYKWKRMYQLHYENYDVVDCSTYDVFCKPLPRDERGIRIEFERVGFIFGWLYEN